jgi:hypothetical protein
MSDKNDAQGSAAGGYEKYIPADELAKTKRLLKRVKVVARRINERVRRVTADTNPDTPALKTDTSPEVPPLKDEKEED